MTVGKRLTELMEMQGFSASALGRKSGVSQTMISSILREESKPTVVTLDALCKGLGISLSAFFAYDDEKNVLSSDEKLIIKQFRNVSSIGKDYIIASVDAFHGRYKVRNIAEEHPVSNIISGVRSIPVIGRAAAGKPIEMIKTDDGKLPVDAAQLSQGDFAVVAVGDSMVDVGIRDNDRIVIRSQPMVENGEIALVAVDDSSTIKRFYKDAHQVRLVPANEAYEPQIYPAGYPVRVLGKVIAVLSGDDIKFL